MSDAIALLVHGAWGSPALWSEVEQRLAAAGVETSAADLPTMRSKDATLADDVAVVRAIPAGRTAVLCGHSYGGAVITEAATTMPEACHLVYLAAFVLEEGETVLELMNARSSPGGGRLDFRDDGTVLPAEWDARVAQYSEPTRSRLTAVPPRPFAARAALTPMAAPAWRTLDSTYLLATQDSFLHPDTQREMSARATRTIEIGSDHFPQLARPDEVASLIAVTVMAHASGEILRMQ